MTGTVEGEVLVLLRQTVGKDRVIEHDAIHVDGCPLTVTLQPADADALAGALALLAERKHAVVIRGGGSRLTLGNPPRDARLFLSTRDLSGIDELDADDGVVHVLAGTPLSELRREANAAGWEVPLDPPGAGCTVGGTLAAAATGPRRQGFGAPRDCVLGLGVSLASGERTRCGGRVVKNVTGYDMAKLYTGSLGTLGVIESAWLRLTPLPEHTRTIAAELPAESSTFEVGLAVARRDSARSVCLTTSDLTADTGSGLPQVSDGSLLCVVEFAGNEASVERDAAWLLDEIGRLRGSRLAANGAIDAVRVLQGQGSLRARLALLPSQVVGRCLRLLEADVSLVVYPGLGCVYAIADAAEDRVLAALAAVDAAAGGDADLVLEALPLAHKTGRDVFGDPGPRLKVMRALKERFDPAGTLNPGRFQGRL